jgi:hypothetical protein
MSAPHYANEDPAPDLATVLQVTDARGYPEVPVRVTEPVSTYELPSRVAVVLDYALTGTAFQQVIGEDPKRKRCLIIGDADFFITHSQSGNNRQGGYWPAKVALEWCNTSAVYARASAGTVNLTVIAEEFAD